MGLRSPLDVKVKNLIRAMTLEEKVAQLCSVSIRDLLENSGFSQVKAKAILDKGIGQITRIAGISGAHPRDAAAIANAVQKFLVEETRSKIPAIVHEECLSGFMAKGATTFPQAIGLASTWNPELVEKVASVMREQMRAAGAHQGLAPVLDVVRDPRWGRTEETFGEDPYLVSSIGVAYVRGIQGKDLKSGVISTPKHFAAHGFSEGGRNCAPVHVSSRELREVFLLPFEAAIKKAKAYSLMNAYHEIDGMPCASSRELLTEILRKEWGFKGFVVSDYGSVRMLQTVHHVAADEREAAIQALEAGIDVELPTIDCYCKSLVGAVREGLMSQAVLDAAVARVLRAKFLLGLFDNPYVDAEHAHLSFDTEKHRKLALQTARKSVVLLKNAGVLPLSKSTASIAVVGPNADSTRSLLGDYSYTAHLSCETDAVPVVSILQGIRSKTSPQTKVYYAEGCSISGESTEGFEEALNAAKDSDVVLVVVGERSGLSHSDVSGEGRDRARLGLPGVQAKLVRALCAAGKPVVVILVNGRPLSLSWIAENCDAIIEVWLPGEEGGNAIADVLFGDYNPGGKLPVTFPAEVGQVPVNYNRKPSSFRDYVFVGGNPLFPFGHGLSYTKFEYSSLSIFPEKVDPVGKITVSFKLKNVGSTRGDEVTQLYVQDEVASVSRPVKELKGFKRIELQAEEQKAISFEISTEQLAFYDKRMKLAVEPGTFEIMVGSSSDDIRLTGKFEVIGNTFVLPSRRVFFSKVTVG